MVEMQETIRCDSLQVIKNVIRDLKLENFLGILETSDHIIHCASIYQDKNSISLSVSIYALGKMVERRKKIPPTIFYMLEDAREALVNRNYDAYHNALKKLLVTISQEDYKIGKYIRRVVNDAQIKKGFKLYEHGISLGQTAELLGISHWELMKYAGNVKMFEYTKDKIPLKQRLQYSRSLFNVPSTR